MLDNTTASSPSIFSSISCCKIHVVNGVPAPPARAATDRGVARVAALPARRAAVVFFVATIARAQAEVAADIVCVLYLSSRSRARVRQSPFVRVTVLRLETRRPIHRPALSPHPSRRAARPSLAPGPRSPARRARRVIARHRASSRVADRAHRVRGVRTRVAIARALSIGDARSARSRRPAIARERRSTREVRSTRDRPRREVRRAIERSMRRSTATARATPRETATR